MQNNVISIRITSLHGSQPSFVVVAFKTASFGSELQVSIGPRLRLLICECKTTCLDPEWRLSIGSQPSAVVLCIQNSVIMTRINILYGSQTSPVVLCMHNSVISTRITSLHGSQTSPVVCACKTTWLASVYMGPSPHLWLLDSKLLLLDPNWKCLYVPDFACWFVNAKQRA